MGRADDRCADTLRTRELCPSLECILVSIDRDQIGPGMAHRTQQPTTLISPDGTTETCLLEPCGTHSGRHKNVLDRVGRKQPDCRR
jgi:hypothetical protein